MVCTVLYNKKYLVYKVSMNNTISSDESGLSGYRKIPCVVWKMQMCPMSSGCISVI